MEVIFLVVLVIVSVVYLGSLFFKRGAFQAVTKGLLVPLVMAVYIFGTDHVLLLIILALVLGWAGDISLIKITNIPFFRMGLASFLAGHICYIIAMLRYTTPLNVPVLLISLAAAAAMGFGIYKFVRPSKEMKLPAIVYEIVILTMAVSALQLYVVNGSTHSLLVFLGSLCFLASDTMLAFFTFGKNTKYGDFLVMLTYISAQTLIAVGFWGFG